MVSQELLLKKVSELYSSYGIKVCSMDDVARVCGISKKTLYSLFANKYELVETLIASVSSWFSTSYNEVRKNSGNAVEEVFGALEMLDPLYRRMHYRMFNDLEKYYHQIWRKLESYREETGLELISTNIQRGIREGLFTDKYDIGILSTMRLNQLDMIHRQADKINLHTTLHQTTEHYLRGLATDKGIKEINKFLLTSTITDNQK
jgi:AcrR family transcriptional regulator